MQIMNLDGERHETVWNEYLRADYATWEVGQDCPVHFHKDAAEIFVILDGECEMTVGDEVQIVRAGQAVYAGPGEAHKLKAIGDRPMRMFLFVTPNHQPTHTMVEPDGTLRDTNRQPPGSEIVWLGKNDRARITVEPLEASTPR